MPMVSAYTEWLGAVCDTVAQARIRVRLREAQAGNCGDSEPVGEGGDRATHPWVGSQNG